MALRLWLPLNKNIVNYGLDSDVTMVSGATTTFGDSEMFGKCLVFAGNTGNSVCDNDKRTSLNFTDNFSWTIWVSHNYTAGSTQYAFTVGRADAGSWGYGLQNTNTTNLRMKFGSNGNYDIPVTANEWTHLAFTKSGSTIKAYKNGTLYNTYTFTGTLPSYSTSEACGLGVGCFYYASKSRIYPFYGKLCDLRIYDNVLSDADVAEIYQAKEMEALRQEVAIDKKVFDLSNKMRDFVPYNVIQSGSSMYFNGSSSYITFSGVTASGGTFSTWINVPTKPTAQKIIIHDPVSKICIGFLANSLLLANANGNMQGFATKDFTYGAWHHLAVVYGQNSQPSNLYLDGVAMVRSGSTTNWSNGTASSIGRRITTSLSTDWFNGYLNDLTIYKKQLTENEIKAIYNRGLNEITTDSIHPLWRGMYLEYSGCTWVKVLHHTSASTQLFTAANCKNNDDVGLMSKLYLYDDADRLKTTSNNYQFLVMEKLTDESVENVGMWVQTSNPTASTVAGYQLLYSGSTNPNKSFGLKRNGNYAQFHNGSVWWCACGSYTPHQGGIPGFWGIVTTGYLDLYARIDNTDFLNKP